MPLAEVLLKLNASPAGGATIMMIVTIHLIRYGPSGVPKGFVDAQNLGYGRTPCLSTNFSMIEHP